MTFREHLQLATIRVMRSALSVRRPSPQANARRLRARGESLSSLVLRDATPGDLPALARLHVTAWNDTYAPLMTGPPVDVRLAQWEAAFAQPDPRWFSLLLVGPQGRLVGFCKAIHRPDHPIPGELNKLFLLRPYQRLGLGRHLMGQVAARFLSQGIDTMAAYVDPRNPSCRFFEALGGEWLREPDGRLNFSWYVWSSLRALAARCQVPGPFTQ